MSELTARQKRNWGLALVGALCVWFFWNVREVLNPLLLAYLLAFIVHPFVLRLEARGWSRMKAVNAIYVFATVCTLLLMIGFWSQGSSLIGKVVRQAQGAEEGGLFTNLDERFGDFVEQNRDRAWMQWLSDDEEESVNSGSSQGDEGSGPGGEQGTEAMPGGSDGSPDGSDRVVDQGGAGVPGSEEGSGPDNSSQPEGAQGLSELDPETSGMVGPREPTAAEGRGLGEGGGDALAGNQAPQGEGGLAMGDSEVHLLPSLQKFWNEVVLEMDVAYAGSAARRSLRWVSSWFGSFLGLMSMLILLPIYTWFLLFELERVHRFIRRHLPRDGRQRYTRVGKKIGDVLTNFLRGQLVVCLLKGLTITVGLLIAGVPYALFLGLTAGFMALIPFFGAFLAAVFAGLVGLLSMDFVPLLWRIVLVFGVAELLEGYVYVPRIIGGSLGLHPLAVLIAVMMGGAAMGMFGFLIALPLVASLVLVAKEFLMPAVREWADEPTEDARPDEPGLA